VTIVPGKGDVYSASRDLNFTFNVSKFEPNLTVIKLDFDKPTDVSTSQAQDYIDVNFKHTRCFTST